MTKYLLNRILRSLFSIIIVVAIVMILIYSCLDRNLILSKDSAYQKKKNNDQEIYKMQRWEKYGYIDYVPYEDFLGELTKSGKLDADTYSAVVKFGDTAAQDSAAVAEYVRQFTEKYKSEGYEVVRLNANYMPRGGYKDGGKPKLFAYRNIPVLTRLWDYFSGIIVVDNIHNVKADIEDRGLDFVWRDPVYGGKKFSPAIMGNGTTHKYLLYFDDNFPYIHQNLVKIKLGTSYVINEGVDVYDTMVMAQGALKNTTLTYPSGLVEKSADNLHTLTYMEGSYESGSPVIKRNYVDDYTQVAVQREGLSKTGYSFVIGVISVIMAYALGIPIGTLLALKKDKLVDKLGTIYIVFIIAVPSLAYIFLFKAIGGRMGLPGTFDMQNPTWLMYVLPVVSLALPSIANLMKWLRRYMIDQMNSDYVKFARSGGLSEGEIFSKHVLKNAIIPIAHGIPSAVLGSVVGAIITERVYSVPGAGRMLTNAINAYDNGVIVGMTLFYALLTVVSIILGDVLISLIDPRISFTAKKR